MVQQKNKVQIKKISLNFNPAQATYYFDGSFESIGSVTGYSARQLKTFSKFFTFNTDKKGRAYVQWDLVNGAQATSDVDDFIRADGPVANGWTTYKPNVNEINEIKSNKLYMRNREYPYAWGSRDFSVNVRPNTLDGGGVADGTDDNPLTMQQKASWLDNTKILNSVGVGGVFMYWDSDGTGRSFLGLGVGQLGVTSGFCCGNAGTWEVVSVPAIIRYQYAYLKINLCSSTVGYYYSFTGDNDDFHEINTTLTTRAISGAPSHFIIGRGYADNTTGNTYMRNVIP